MGQSHYFSKLAISILLFSTMAITTRPALLCEAPLAGDYDGDGKCDPAIHTRSLGSWQIRLSSLNYGLISTTLGASAFTPLAGESFHS